jgi:hypothetical protein
LFTTRGPFCCKRTERYFCPSRKYSKDLTHFLHKRPWLVYKRSDKMRMKSDFATSLYSLYILLCSTSQAWKST